MIVVQSYCIFAQMDIIWLFFCNFVAKYKKHIQSYATSLYSRPLRD